MMATMSMMLVGMLMLAVLLLCLWTALSLLRLFFLSKGQRLIMTEIRGP